eukprot:m.118298 g.118298  ORF g.118298 m.118298 type:complete len:252 (+) comp13231_c0_seq1:292-1047(+)
MYSFVSAVYSTQVPTRVTYRSPDGRPRAIGVADGLLQGDPLAAMLFTGLNVAARKAANDIGGASAHASETQGGTLQHTDFTPSGVELEYIDDATMSAGSPELGQRMMTAALETAKESGQEPAPGKMVIASYSQEALDPERWKPLQDFLDANFGEGHIVPEFVHLDKMTAGLTVLGRPIGGRAFVEEYLQGKLEGSKGVAQNMRRMFTVPLCSQTRLLLFRYCILERITYYSRTCTFQEFSKAAGWMSELTT